MSQTVYTLHAIHGHMVSPAESSFLFLFFYIQPWPGRSPVNLPHNFRTPFYKNTSGGLLLYINRYI